MFLVEATGEGIQVQYMLRYGTRGGRLGLEG